MVHSAQATSYLTITCVVALIVTLAGVLFLFASDPTAQQVVRPRLSASTSFTNQLLRTDAEDFRYSPSQSILQERQERHPGQLSRFSDHPSQFLQQGTALNSLDPGPPALEANRTSPFVSEATTGQPPPTIQQTIADGGILHSASDSRSEVPGCVDPVTSPIVTAFDRLPERYGPDDPSWNNSIAICACMRDENITDVREWLQYYRWLGVDHVLLTENNSHRPMREGLRDFIDAGFLTYRQDSRPYAQMKSYHWCLQQHRTDFNWMAFFDADEYLALRAQRSTLKQLLERFKYEAGIQVHWVLVGSNGRERRPEEGGVLRHYTTCDPTPGGSSKVIVNTYYTAATIGHPHTAMFWDCKTTVNEAKIPFPLDEKGRGFPNHVSRRPRVRRLALFHFATKSKEDFAIKAARRGGSGRAKTQSYFDEAQRNQVSDPLCEELRLIADECCSPEGFSSPATQAA